MPAPLFTVIVPTVDRPRYVVESLDSVLAQTLTDFELIVVDDAATAETQAAVAHRARDDARIKVLRTAERSGPNVARNLALDAARGKYVAFLDDDDVAVPTRLERTLARLETEPRPDAVFSRARLIDARGNPGMLAPSRVPFAERDALATGERMFELVYCDWLWIPTSTLALRAAAIGDVRYPSVRRSDGDAMFHALLALAGLTFARLDEPLALVRRDDSHACMSSDRRQLLRARRETLRALRALLAQRGDSRRDPRHARAWSNHLVCEAEHFGGLRGLGLALAALRRWPRSSRARAYVRSRLAARRPPN